MGVSAITPSWQQPADKLDQQSLRALIAGDVPAILIEGFATLDECRALCRAIRTHGGRSQNAQTSRMNLIGANFSNYAGETKAGYFDLVGPSYDTLRSILDEAGFN
ncbi:MAG: hypothetical protein ACR2QH_09330, partial [Geminicoccaceae bacterium]